MLWPCSAARPQRRLRRKTTEADARPSLARSVASDAGTAAEGYAAQSPRLGVAPCGVPGEARCILPGSADQNAHHNRWAGQGHPVGRDEAARESSPFEPGRSQAWRDLVDLHNSGFVVNWPRSGC